MLKLNTEPLQAEYSLESNELWVEGARASIQARHVREMTDVLADRLFASKARPDDALYYIFRGPHRKEDAPLFSKHHLRYDITTIPARALGSEFVKTYGHYHPLAPQSKHAFAELYEVISGTAWYLIQKRKDPAGTENGDTLAVEDVVLVEAKAGDKVLMPPDYGHLTVNPSFGELLVMANLVEGNFKSDYAPYKERRGGAYYVQAEGQVAANPMYGEVPKLERTTASKFWGNKAVKAMKDNIYAEFVANPEQFSFLRKPDELF